MKILFVPKEFPHSKVIGGPILVYNRIKYLSENHKIGLASFMREGDRKYLDTLEPYMDEIELMPYPKVRNRFRKHMIISSQKFHLIWQTPDHGK
ncbi:MAG: hypothetical protein ABUK08_07450 [Candidatus Humimicrobiaceae bacterium]